MLAAKYHLPAASTGALLREQRARGTELGRAADAFTSAGRFFPDDIALAIVREWMNVHVAEGWILDGFPRTAGQACAFDAEFGAPDVVFHLDLPAAVSRERIAQRITCAHCGASFRADLDGVGEGQDCPSCGRELVRRRDDTLALLDERLEQHHAHTAPVLAHYRVAGRLEEVAADADRATIFAALCTAVEEGRP